MASFEEFKSFIKDKPYLKDKVKKGKSPKAAPTYIEENVQTGYRCKICKYVYEGDIFSEPADFVCPICKQPKHVFEKI